MKKLIALLLATVMVLGLVACGGSSAPAATEAPASNGSTGTPNTSDDGIVRVDIASLDEKGRAEAEGEIRYALSLLLDRNYIVENITQAGQVPASSFVSRGMTEADGSQFYENAGPSDEYAGYFNVAPEAYEDNYAEAYAILSKYYEVDANGMFTNFPTFTYMYNTSEGHKAIGEYVQSALAGVGINVQLENQEWNTFINTRKSGDYFAARHAWTADYNDPNTFLDMWITSSGNNDTQFGRGDHANKAIYSIDLTDLGYDIKVENGTWAETYDVLIDTAKKCSDPEVHYEILHRAEDMLMATGCITPLYFYVDPYMLNASVDGFYGTPLGFKFFDKTTVDGKNDSISVCIASEPDTIDPALNSALDGGTMTSHLFAGLTKWAVDENGVTYIAPDCLTELPEGVTNEDGTVTYTYTLYDGLKWSDGQDLTAHDFEFAWKRAASSELGADYCYMFDVIKGYPDDLAVTALDDTTLEVTLNNAVAYWNELMAFPCYFPVREDVVANEAWATDPSTYVSNGRYTLTGWEHDSVITMTKNPNYHDADNVVMNEIKFFLSDDQNNMLTNWKNGAWQLIDDLPTNEMAAIKAEYAGRADKRDEYIVGPNISTYFICWNVNKSLLP